MCLDGRPVLICGFAGERSVARAAHVAAGGDLGGERCVYIYIYIYIYEKNFIYIYIYIYGKPPPQKTHQFNPDNYTCTLKSNICMQNAPLICRHETQRNNEHTENTENNENNENTKNNENNENIKNNENN